MAISAPAASIYFSLLDFVLWTASGREWVLYSSLVGFCASSSDLPFAWDDLVIVGSLLPLA